MGARDGQEAIGAVDRRKPSQQFEGESRRVTKFAGEHRPFDVIQVDHRLDRRAQREEPQLAAFGRMLPNLADRAGYTPEWVKGAPVVQFAYGVAPTGSGATGA